VDTSLRDAVTEANDGLARSAVYRLLAQVLSYPTPAGVEQLLEEDVPLALALAPILSGPVGTLVADLAAALEGVTREALERAYLTAFTHVHSADCSLYETDYTAARVWRQSQELADLGGFYRAFGVEERMERPDHVAVELEFLHLLAYKAAWAAATHDREHVRTCERAREAFLADHALRWMPGLLERLEVLGAGGPYAAVARLARRFLSDEAARFGLRTDAGPTPTPAAHEGEAEGDPALCEGE